MRRTLLSAQSPPRLERVHLKVAEAIESEYGAEIEDHVADMAHHLWRAGSVADPDKTAHYLALAGERAVQRSAYEQAFSYLTPALNLMRKLPGDQDRIRRELQASIALSHALQASKGLAAREHEQLNARMLDLSQRLEERDQSFSVLTLLWSFFLTRGDLISARTTSQEIMDIAHELNNPLVTMHGKLALGTLFYQGELKEARRYLEEAAAANSPSQVQRPYAADPQILCFCHLAWTLWFLGFPDQAITQMQQALRIADAIGEPYGITYERWFHATVHELRGEYKETLVLSDDVLSRARDQSFPEFAALGAIWHGTALVAEGIAEPGLAEMKHGISAFFAANHGLGDTAILGILAGALLAMEKVDEALATVDEALQVAARTGEQFYVPELHRLKGEALLARSSDSGEQASDCFDMACAIARAQGGRSLELRALRSLAELERKRGGGVRARKALIEVLGWFEEGLQTGDLRLARPSPTRVCKRAFGAPGNRSIRGCGNADDNHRHDARSG